MSTEFTSRVTGELGFVRWSTHSGCRYEFGTVTNWEHVVELVHAGDQFHPIDGYVCDTDPITTNDLKNLVASGRASFGEFSITVELGSGELYRFTVEE